MRTNDRDGERCTELLALFIGRKVQPNFYGALIAALPPDINLHNPWDVMLAKNLPVLAHAHIEHTLQSRHPSRKSG
jgi:hypothetical protein